MFDRLLHRLESQAFWRQKPSAMEEIFQRIYRAQEWGQEETLSGPGSTADRTKSIRSRLPALLKAIGAKSLLDAPCGDHNWMRLMPLEIKYVGVDIVSEIISRNERQFGSRRVKFLQRDITRDRLPRSDVILCRDCLVHLSSADIFATLENFRRTGAKHLLTTTFIEHRTNLDIQTGDWRQLNFELEPFLFPPPIEAIDEQWGGGLYQDKRLALWALADIPDFSRRR